MEDCRPKEHVDDHSPVPAQDPRLMADPERRCLPILLAMFPLKLKDVEIMMKKVFMDLTYHFYITNASLKTNWDILSSRHQLKQVDN